MAGYWWKKSVDKTYLSSKTKCDTTHRIDCYEFGHTESSGYEIVFVQQLLVWQNLPWADLSFWPYLVVLLKSDFNFQQAGISTTPRVVFSKA